MSLIPYWYKYWHNYDVALTVYLFVHAGLIIQCCSLGSFIYKAFCYKPSRDSAEHSTQTASHNSREESRTATLSNSLSTLIQCCTHWDGDGTNVLAVIVLSAFVCYFLQYCIFFNLTMGADIFIECGFQYFTFIWLVISRTALIALFIQRLHATFKDSVYAYSKRLLVGVMVAFVICAITSTAAFLGDMYATFHSYNNENKDCLLAFDFGALSMLPVFVDFIFNTLLLFLFNFKLYQLIKVTSENTVVSQTSPRATVTVSQPTHSDTGINDGLIKVMTKLTVLVTVALLTTWLALAGASYAKGFISATIDSIVNSLCCIWVFSVYKKPYKRYCKPCRRLARKVCISVVYGGFVQCCCLLCNCGRSAEQIEAFFKQSHRISKMMSVTPNLRPLPTHSASPRSRDSNHPADFAL